MFGLGVTKQHMERISTHSHTSYCGHGEGTIEELVSAACAARLSTLAITEHYPLSLAFDPVGYLSMPKERLGDYLGAIEQARLLHPEIELLAGCEFDYLGAYEDRDLSAIDFSAFSVVLGSVHFVDAWPFDDPAQRDRWNEPGAPDEIWERYFALWCEAATSELPFTIMSHPDLAKKFDFYPTRPLQRYYDDAAEAAAASGRMIEVNTSGSYYACNEMFPSPKLLETFCRAGVECTVGTDAHAPALVDRDIEKGYRAMYEAGYRVVTVPTADGDRRHIAIE